jgi:hypothetical protein
MVPFAPTDDYEDAVVKPPPPLETPTIATPKLGVSEVENG